MINKNVILVCFFSMLGNYVICNKPKIVMPGIPEEEALEVIGYLEMHAELQRLAKIRHEAILEQRGVNQYQATMPNPKPIAVKKKPAGRCAGCTSRLCQLVKSFISYCSAKTNTQD